MSARCGFSVAQYDASGVVGTNVVHPTGVIVYTATAAGEVKLWYDTQPDPPGPADLTLAIEDGDKVVITPVAGGFSISVVSG